ncbi:uncharacterized protein DS421_1g29520 [Arachis hypogaea]|nr:uncharacterized protein DS421_1g29520 [Arachis hypogaea]
MYLRNSSSNLTIHFPFPSHLLTTIYRKTLITPPPYEGSLNRKHIQYNQGKHNYG